MPKQEPNPQVWRQEGWYYFLPKKEQHGQWLHIVNCGNAAVGNYFRAYQNGGYYNIEDFGKGVWYGPLPADPARFLEVVPNKFRDTKISKSASP